MKYYLSGRCCMLFNVLPPLISAYWHIRYQVGEVKVVGYQYVVVDAACLCVEHEDECTTVRVLCYWHCVWWDSPSCFDKREYSSCFKKYIKMLITFFTSRNRIFGQILLNSLDPKGGGFGWRL